jgi:3-oxoacyl-(acyl-carrier-protein) synthase/NAD(P)-dependent dehydrogenase (short-subunit alcohol dehydrogenase family)
VYAPNSAGQNLAVKRALGGEGLDGDAVDWVNAHATGTPAGDLAEFTTLRQHYGRERTAFVTSNKSLIGHTGWAAGVVSLIETVLGMQEQLIPDQPRFVRAPEDFRMADTKLSIPTECQSWPIQEGRRRIAAISSFGFGGTNAHLLVAEPQSTPIPPGIRAPSRQTRVAIVGWSAHLPGLATPGQITEWMRGGQEPDASFGAKYPAPPFQRVKLPPSTIRTTDRCQLMLLECAYQLRDQMPEFWKENMERTGVMVGHMGPTRASMLFGYRCYLDDIETALSQAPSVGGSTSFPALLDGLRKRVRALIPPSNEDSFPGMMPNIISARVANYFDLKGANMTVDSGLASTLSSIEIASRYVRSGELELALAGGINGNSLPEYDDLLSEIRGTSDNGLAEGAFLFALASEEAAAKAGLPVLGYIDELSVTAKPRPTEGRTVDCGVTEPRRTRYLGASGAVGLLQALHGPAGPVTLECGGERSETVSRLRIQVTGALVRTPDPTVQCVVERFVPWLAEDAPRAVRPALPFFPSATVLVTDAPELLASLELPADITVLSTEPVTHGRPGWVHLAEVNPASVANVLATVSAVRHVRLVVDLAASAPKAVAADGVPDRLLRIHDAIYLVLQQCYDELSAQGCSVVALQLRALADGVPHPASGLVTGLMKTLNLELTECLVLAAGTATGNIADAVAAVEYESTLHRSMPSVYLEAGHRWMYRLHTESISGPLGGRLPLDERSVVVALGGARGITAEVVKALAAAARPTLYLLGSNRLDDYPAQMFEGSDEHFAVGRADYLKSRRGTPGAGTIADLNREFERRLDARAARRNIDQMTALCGEGRVTYLPCDARDEGSVRQVMDEILRRESRIDLLINAAGRNHSGRIRDKDFAEFTAIRNLKVGAYRNLRSALSGRLPRLWCNFGSLIGYFGQVGEADYASANDVLASAAVATTEGIVSGDHQEFTIGWTLWDGVGMGANEISKAYFKRAGLYSHMPIAEGVQHFLEELAAPVRRGAVVHLGAAERKTVESIYPDYLTDTEADIHAGADADAGVRADGAGTDEPAPFYLRGEVSRDHVSAVWECPFDLRTDSYLRHHLVRDIPTLPGTFVTELAAEAARSLVPDTEVIALQDLTFHHFLRVYDNTSAPPRRIRAEILGREGDVTRVAVRVTADVVAPSGAVLARDKLHFTTTVLLSAQFPVAPSWSAWDELDVTPCPDPYHLPGSPVLLSGPFNCTRDTRLHPLGKRARFEPAAFEAGPLRDRFTVPVVLLDALARTGVLSLVDGTLIPIAAPLSIRRVDLYQRANDRQLIADHGSLELYVTPSGFGMDGDNPINRFVAVTPGGRVVAQLKDVSATAIGYVNAVTGGFHNPDRSPDLASEDRSRPLTPTTGRR